MADISVAGCIAVVTSECSRNLDGITFALREGESSVIGRVSLSRSRLTSFIFPIVPRSAEASDFGVSGSLGSELGVITRVEYQPVWVGIVKEPVTRCVVCVSF